MKIDSKNLTRFPNARYIVENGKVKMIGFDKVSQNVCILNISNQRNQYTLWEIIMKRGLGKQYV